MSTPVFLGKNQTSVFFFSVGGLTLNSPENYENNPSNMVVGFHKQLSFWQICSSLFCKKTFISQFFRGGGDGIRIHHLSSIRIPRGIRTERSLWVYQLLWFSLLWLGRPQPPAWWLVDGWGRFGNDIYGFVLGPWYWVLYWHYYIGILFGVILVFYWV